MHGALKYRYLCNKFYTSILKTSRDNHVIKNKSRNCHEKRLNQAVVYNTVIIVQILNMKIPCLLAVHSCLANSHSSRPKSGDPPFIQAPCEYLRSPL